MRPPALDSASDSEVYCDELDFAVVNALQIDPRAPWNLVAKALQVDPATVARRWERLATRGIAWVTGYAPPGAHFSGLVEITCGPTQAAQVAEQLSTDPHASTVVHVTGEADLLVSVMTRDFFSFTRYVVERLNQMPGVVSTRSHPFAHSYREGSRWRLDGLDPGQRTILGRKSSSSHPPPFPGGSTESMPMGDERPIVLALAEDGRRSVTELADSLGVSPNTARRRLHRLLDSGRIVLRCELAHTLTSWPVIAVFWAHVPSEAAGMLAHQVARMRQVRICATTASGPGNLVFTVGLRSVEGIQDMEGSLAREMPAVKVLERSLVMRPVKLAGSLLDVNGCRTRSVAMDIHRDPVPGP